MKIKIIKQSAIMRRGGMFGYGAWPSVARTGDNKLTAVWSGGRIKHLCPFGKVMASDSFDGGMTWTEPRTLIDTPLDDRDAGLAVSGKTQIVTTFNNRVATQREWNREPGIDPVAKKAIDDYLDSVKAEDEDKYYGSLTAVSNDGGETFSAVHKIAVTAPHGPIALQKGGFLYVGRWFDPAVDVPPEGDGIYALYSSDGYSWSNPVKVCGACDDKVRLYCEPHVAELATGEIIVGLRAHERDKTDDKFTVYTCFSKDGGKTFSSPESVDFPGSPPHFCITKTGTAVLSYARRDADKAVYARFSSDGRSWSDAVRLSDISESGDLGYPATVETDDGKLCTVYYQKLDGDDNASILCTVWECSEK